MKKAATVAIYARYSSELQNSRSCADQIKACRGFILKNEKISPLPIEVYEDAAQSGARMTARPAVNRLLQDIEAGEIGYVISEGIDRISRSQEDIARVFNICQYNDVEILTMLEGVVSEIHVGLNGAMSAVTLKQTGERTRRGQAGNILAGKAAGGLPYGYKVKFLNDDGKPEHGLRDIDPVQATIVQRIYKDFCEGQRPSQIVASLNQEGIPSPRGKKWSPVTITGHHGRGNGILQNPIYKGAMLWNRHNFDRHPRTGVRHVRQNSKDEWIVHHNEGLRIITDDQWERAQQIISERRGGKTATKKQTYPDIGINVHCASCGGRMQKQSPSTLICSIWKRNRDCSQSLRINTQHLCDAIYEHIEREFTSVCAHWQALLEKENIKKQEARKHPAKQPLAFFLRPMVLDDVSKGILLKAIRSQRKNKASFAQKIIATATVSRNEAGEIIVSDLSPRWDALEKLQ